MTGSDLSQLPISLHVESLQKSTCLASRAVLCSEVAVRFHQTVVASFFTLSSLVIKPQNGSVNHLPSL